MSLGLWSSTWERRSSEELEYTAERDTEGRGIEGRGRKGGEGQWGGGGGVDVRIIHVEQRR